MSTRHARSHEGRLQVEAAQLRHLLPRLAGGRSVSRLGGGIGTRGPGEQKLEVDRRRIRHRISQLKAEITKLEKSRGLHRQARRRAEVPVLAVVGYTNSGKSSLMNALTGAGVLEADQLFATLDPTTRAVELPDGRRVLLTHTVGVIQKLPTDLILHVLDASHPAMRDHFEATNEVLEDLDAIDKPLVLAFNKCDLLDRGTVAMMRRRGDWTPYQEVVPISARTGLGLPVLLEAIERQTRLNLVELDLLVPYDHAGVESDLRQHGRVLKLDYVEEGIRIAAEVPGNLAPRFAEFAKTPAG